MLLTVDDDEKLKSVLNLGGEDYSHGGIRENTEMWFLTESVSLNYEMVNCINIVC